MADNASLIQYLEGEISKNEREIVFLQGQLEGIIRTKQVANDEMRKKITDLKAQNSGEKAAPAQPAQEVDNGNSPAAA